MAPFLRWVGASGFEIFCYAEAVSKRPKVLIIYTGGTFGMEAANHGKGRRTLSTPDLKPLALSQRLKERVPELRGLAQCDVKIALNRDSAHIGPEEWKSLAELVRSNWEKYDGIVLLHGTDTMAYTASALSFLLRPCLKPVVITGAQRPLSALRTDARRNLIAAVEIAAHGPRALVSQVTVFFDNRLFQGNRVRKRSASDFGAFDSPQAAPLALVGTEIRYTPHSSVRRSRGSQGKAPLLLHEFDRNVALLHITPGFPARAIRERLLPGLSALVMVVFPSGTAPTHDPEFIRLLQEARKAGTPVVIASEGHSDASAAAASLSRQGPRGGAHPSIYAAGAQLLSEGGHWAGTMTPECAFVKTSWILAQPGGRRRFAALWRRCFAAES